MNFTAPERESGKKAVCKGDKGRKLGHTTARIMNKNMKQLSGKSLSRQQSEQGEGLNSSNSASGRFETWRRLDYSQAALLTTAYGSNP